MTVVARFRLVPAVASLLLGVVLIGVAAFAFRHGLPLSLDELWTWSFDRAMAGLLLRWRSRPS